MAKKKKNIIAKMQIWMDSRQGQMFLNYAYSWGASIVILGALFKLTHIAGADLMLFLGMGTEVFVFFLAGFERPYDEDGKTPVNTAEEETSNAATGSGTVVIGGNIPSGGTIIIGGGYGQQAVSNETSDSEHMVSGTNNTEIDATQLADTIESSPLMTSPQFAGMTPEMQEATQKYVEQLQELTDTLKKVAEQSARLTRDSEEMENMNRTLTGINRFYEMQLRSVGTQSSTIDKVNEQTTKLAAQLEELNQVYARMVDALKVNIAGNPAKDE